MIEHLSDVEYIWGTPEWFDDYVICQVRLPRAIAGAIAGGALALAGLAMQGVLKNPLADAYTTGVSSGACLGAVMAIALGLRYRYERFPDVPDSCCRHDDRIQQDKRESDDHTPCWNGDLDVLRFPHQSDTAYGEFGGYAGGVPLADWIAGEYIMGGCPHDVDSHGRLFDLYSIDF